MPNTIPIRSLIAKAAQQLIHWISTILVLGLGKKKLRVEEGRFCRSVATRDQALAFVLRLWADCFRGLAWPREVMVKV